MSLPATITTSGYGAQNGLKLSINSLIYILEDWTLKADHSTTELFLDTGDIGAYIDHIKKWTLNGTLKLVSSTLFAPALFQTFTTPTININGAGVTLPMQVSSCNADGGANKATSYAFESRTVAVAYPTS